MANARIAHLNLDGSTEEFDVTFPYINQSHVIIKLDGVATTAFTWLTTTRVLMDSMPAAASNLIITRESSPTTRLVDYQTGSILSESVLDTDSNQAFYLCQEALDVKEEVFNVSDSTDQWDGQSKRITNVADPIGAQDAATKNYIESTWLSSGDKTNLTTIAGLSANLTLLGTADAVADMNLLATTDVIADMNTLAVADVVADINTLGTADVVADMNTLGTADVVADMNTLGTADVVADMNTLGTADVVADMNTLATADVVADMNLLATADIVADMNTLGTADVVADMNTLGTAGNVTAMDTCSTNIGSINTNATNISAITAASAAAGLQSVDNFSGNASTTAFTLSQSPSTENNTGVYIDGVYQQKNTYSVSGAVLTFSEAPPSGTDNIEVMHLSTQPTGVAPTVAATNTLSPGSSATVTAAAHALTFGIPRGAAWTSSTSIPGSGDGLDGDFHFKTDDDKIYKKASGAWAEAADLTGAAATIAIGSTTTAAPGASASVTNSGSSSAATFDFTVPRGSSWTSSTSAPTGGLDGDFHFKSDDEKIYKKSGGSWSELADITGTAATIAVGTVTTGSPASSATVTNSGSSGAATFDFSIPQGDTGAAGAVSGMADGSAAAPSLSYSADSNTGMYRIGADQLGVTTAGTHAMAVDATQQIGIGTTTPAAKLDITNGEVRMTDGRNIQWGGTNVRLQGSNATNTMEFYTSGGEKMRIDANGDLGIGIADPLARLHIEAGASGTGSAALNKIILQGHSGNSLPNGAIEIWGSDAASGGKWGMYTNAVTGSDFVLGYAAASGSYASVYEAQTDKSVDFKGDVNVAGDIVATGNITAYSMAAAKSEVETIANPLDLVDKLRGVSFKWKDKREDQKTLGFVYEEVAEAVPELARQKDDKGSIMYQNTVALLVEAVKTLSAKVKELENKDGPN